ncbi:hypothetical protein PILCRDRAFT_547016 [Piloderma croceum F 1598]|uniref:Uncharacterized protein n=1 Tax=Piloderma croceum (strain F 1598) TaxID=765440 RepID=A0A0C3BR93_PILCF|nr:hypothetical protein PILCRDRAFT_547016 [Piloderma croceum F 1598]
MRSCVGTWREPKLGSEARRHVDSMPPPGVVRPSYDAVAERCIHHLVEEDCSGFRVLYVGSKRKPPSFYNCQCFLRLVSDTSAWLSGVQCPPPCCMWNS